VVNPAETLGARDGGRHALALTYLHHCYML
jgi:hypothetical protein